MIQIGQTQAERGLRPTSSGQKPLPSQECLSPTEVAGPRQPIGSGPALETAPVNLPSFQLTWVQVRQVKCLPGNRPRAPHLLGPACSNRIQHSQASRECPTRPTPPPFSRVLLPGTSTHAGVRSPVDGASTFSLASHSPEECWDRLRPRPRPRPQPPVGGVGTYPTHLACRATSAKGRAVPTLSRWSKNGSVVHVGSDSPRVSLTQKSYVLNPFAPWEV